jgi:capsular polysaccharide transport system permease protein
MARSSWQITWSVWRALFIREAVSRLYHRRAAWAWLLLEPAGHIGFFIFLFSVTSVHSVGGMSAALWVVVGQLGFFMFRRPMNISMAAVAMAKPLFTYRQVKPVDAVIIRAVAEGLLMLVISLVILFVVALLGIPVWPDNLIMVLGALFALWLFGMGVGMILSVLREFVRETEDLVNLTMIPIYFFSGLLFPVAVVPQPYRDLVVFNPIAHGVDALRLGFTGHYQSFNELDLVYVYLVALSCLFIGLVLHRIYQTRLIQE